MVNVNANLMAVGSSTLCMSQYADMSAAHGVSLPVSSAGYSLAANNAKVTDMGNDLQKKEATGETDLLTY